MWALIELQTFGIYDRNTKGKFTQQTSNVLRDLSDSQ